RVNATRTVAPLPLALHRPPAEPQGQDRERDLRPLPLARERIGRAPPDDSRARRGQSLGRGVEVGCPRERPRGLPRALWRRAWPDDDAAGDRRPRSLSPVLPATARARGTVRFAGAFDGDEPGLPRGRRRGRDDGAP